MVTQKPINLKIHYKKVFEYWSINGYVAFDITRTNGNLTVFIRDAPDTVFAGYPAGRISGLSTSRIPDIR
jgi:hypothetical protein